MTAILIIAGLVFAAFASLLFLLVGDIDEPEASGVIVLMAGYAMLSLQGLIWLLVGLRLAGGGL